MIKAEHIAHSFKTRRKKELVINDVSFEISENEIVALTGPSGIGKSTIASIIAGILKPSSGRILFDNKDITGRQNTDIIYVNQETDLFPWMKVGKQIEFVLDKKVSNRSQVVKKSLDDVELTEHIHKYPFQLSGGMQRRLSIARAVAVRPKLIILDEPFTGLDNAIKQKIFADLLKLKDNNGMSILLISHNEDEVQQLADREIILSKSKPTTVENIISIKAKS